MVRKFVALGITLWILIGCTQDNKTIFIEVEPDHISVNGEEVSDLSSSLKSLESCEKVHLMVNRHLESKKVVDVMTIVQEANCENISIQSV